MKELACFSIDSLFHYERSNIFHAVIFKHFFFLKTIFFACKHIEMTFSFTNDPNREISNETASLVLPVGVCFASGTKRSVLMSFLRKTLVYYNHRIYVSVRKYIFTRMGDFHRKISNWSSYFPLMFSSRYSHGGRDPRVEIKDETSI